MDKKEALRIVRSLADGIDPITGEIFSKESTYQDPNIIRALFTAVQALESSIRNEQRRSTLPERAGNPWEESEDKQLICEFDKGKTISELATIHSRTDGGIRSRLEKLGKIKPE